MSDSGVRRALTILFIALLLVAPTVEATPAPYGPKRLTATIYADGYVWVEYEVEVSPFLPVINLTLFGRNYEGVVALGGDGVVLDYNITQSGLQVETLGLNIIKISYFTPDLTNKTGRLWTFTVDAPVSITVKLPSELTVVGLNKAPLTISSEGDAVTLVFTSGQLSLNYIVEAAARTTALQGSELSSIDWVGYAAVAPVMVLVAGVAAFILLRRKRAAKVYEREKRTIDVEKILASKPDLRPDDREVLKFLAESGGEAFESELRSRFNLPKTSTWRMVRRLKREGLVDVKKVGGQNLVYIRDVSEIGGGTDVPKNP